MEVITLKNKKKINWKAISIIGIVLIGLILSIITYNKIHIDYEYYLVTAKQEHIYLGLSHSKRLQEDAIKEYLDNQIANGYLIADFNLQSIVKTKPKIKWGKQQYQDADIMTNIQNELYIVIYALKIEIQNDIIYIPSSKVYYYTSQLENIEHTEEYVYVNMQQLTTKEDFNKIIERYADPKKK